MDKQKLEKYLKYGIIAVLIGVGGFAAAFLIKSIVVLAVVIVGGIAMINGAPVLAQWAAHQKIKGLKANAATNPIPELILQRQKQHEKVNEAIKQVTILGTETRQFKQDLDGFKKTDPDQAPAFEETYLNMAKVYNYQVRKIKQAQDGLKEFDQIISKSQRIWDMTQASIRAGRSLKGFTQPDPMDEIRKQTALDSVSKSMHMAMEEMQMSMMLDYHSIDDLQKTPQLSGKADDILEADFVLVREKLHV